MHFETILIYDISLGRLGYYLGTCLGNIHVNRRHFIVFLEVQVA